MAESPAPALSRRFGSVLAVDALDLSVARGEIFGLIGPDGAGKTTTLRLLAAIMNPTSGRASVLGLDTVRRAAQLKHHIGYMAQRFGLYDDLTVMENLRFFADLFGVGRMQRAERIARLLHVARLEEFSHRQAAQLSGGTQKKLALACTLIHTPELLLLDEPTTGVDPVSRREFWDILSELHLQGITLVISTPYMDEAERCHRLAFIQRGRIVALDTPEEIKRGTMPAGVLEIECEDSQHALAALKTREGLNASLYGSLIHVTADHLESREAEIRTVLVQAGASIVSMQRVPASLEDAFIASLREREQGQGFE